MIDKTLVLVGSSHRTAPLDLLKDLSLSPAKIREQLPVVKERLGLEEVVILSTCNRTEIYASGPQDVDIAGALERWMLEMAPTGSDISPRNLYVNLGEDAAGHLLRTATGLDSMMVGETEIAGQIQDAIDTAREAGTALGFFARLFSSASRAGKRARTETDISAGTTSVASAAVHMAHRIFGDLSRHRALMIGAGETGRLVCRHLAHHGIGKLVVANRSRHAALEVAGEFGGEALALEDRGEALLEADVVVAATHSPEPLITARMVRDVMRRRSSRMLLLVDISMPPNIEASVSSVDNVFLNDMNDLRAMVQRTLDRRSREIPAVEKIVSGELACFAAQQAAMKAGPLIREVRERYEALGAAELERFAARFAQGDREVADRLVGDLINKLLHWPTLELRAMAQDPEVDPQNVAWARRLFGLDRPVNGKGDR